MRLDSNLRGVLTRLDRLQTRDIPMALQRTLHRDDWLKRAHDSAEQSLLLIADPAHRQFIPAFLETLEKHIFKNGLKLKLHTPAGMRSTDFSLEDFVAGKQRSHRDVAPTPAGEKIKTVLGGPVVGQDLFSQSVNELDELVAVWVATEKDKDKRDWSKTDEEIAHFIVQALTTPFGHTWVVRAGKNKGRLVHDVFLPHIVAWLQKQQAAPIAPEIIHAWLLIVRDGWREMFRAQFPALVREELRAARTELNLG